ncbi:MAG: hypothetical protein ACLPSW_35975 [Roseiarcus sp.]
MANTVWTLKNHGELPVVLSVRAPMIEFTILPSDSITVGLPQDLIDKIMAQNTGRGLTHISDTGQGFRGVSYALWSD